ncbi:MAG: hypothetical protein IPN53_06520 [Comamonadaceae bacterium]|nr:hypothetical protein [Comamonadaceae bacterium]
MKAFPRFFTHLAAAGALAICSGGSLAQTAAALAAPARLSLQAKLFFSKSASLSADVLAPGGPELLNVVALDDPSTATLVLVAVALPRGLSLPSDSRVRLVALESAKGRAPAKRLLDSTIPLGVVGTGGITHLGFWLPATGCRQVQLRATLTVARQAGAQSAQSLIPFACGE